MGLFLMLGIGLLAGIVSGIIGAGSSIMLVPVLPHSTLSQFEGMVS